MQIWMFFSITFYNQIFLAGDMLVRFDNIAEMQNHEQQKM